MVYVLRSAAMRLFLAALLFAIAATPSFAEEHTGVVVSVHDGDTLTMLVEKQQVKVRLAEIDAPELRQAFGNRSKESLASLRYDKPARV